jgi:hypothetical protein
MKKDKIVYLVSTWAIFLLISLPAVMFNSEMSRAAFIHLGFPHYFLIEVGIAKILGGLALVLPLSLVGKRVKEWAYVGFGIDFISALIANSAVDGVKTQGVLLALIALVMLIASYKYFHKING